MGVVSSITNGHSYEITGLTAAATDEDYAVIDATTSSFDAINNGNAQSGTNTGATINLGAGTYLIGSAPTTFGLNNLRGSTIPNKNDFGIYKLTTDSSDHSKVNLVAEVKGITLDSTDIANLVPTNLVAVYHDAGSNLYATGNNSATEMGGGNDSGGLTYNNNQFQTATNFAGIGALYNLSGTDFAKYHVHIG